MLQTWQLFRDVPEGLHRESWKTSGILMPLEQSPPSINEWKNHPSKGYKYSKWNGDAEKKREFFAVSWTNSRDVHSQRELGTLWNSRSSLDPPRHGKKTTLPGAATIPNRIRDTILKGRHCWKAQSFSLELSSSYSRVGLIRCPLKMIYTSDSSL